MHGHLRTAVAEARGNFQKAEEGEYLPLEAAFRRLVKTQLTE
jgi:hypothetical protein